LLSKNILARIVVSCAEADAAAILRAVMPHDARDRRLREEDTSPDTKRNSISLSSSMRHSANPSLTSWPKYVITSAFAGA
jgi:hypothetical protein